MMEVYIVYICTTIYTCFWLPWKEERWSGIFGCSKIMVICLVDQGFEENQNQLFLQLLHYKSFNLSP